MDVTLAKTFLEIADTGSFVSAAGRLNVTQTAVSARVRTLEEHLGRRLFVRNKSGARLTPAGERFYRHAATMVQVWDRARQQVGLPPGHIDIANVGAELSLWNPILVDWLVWMKQNSPELAVRASVDMSTRLLEEVHAGALDLAVVYDPPQSSSAVVVELLAEDKLLLVTTRKDRLIGPSETYVHVDWGAQFQFSHHAAFPETRNAGLTVTHGPLALAYLTLREGAGYFRQSAVRTHLETGTLFEVEGAPQFSYSVHMVYPSRSDRALIDRMRHGFKSVHSQPPK